MAAGEETTTFAEDEKLGKVQITVTGLDEDGDYSATYTFTHPYKLPTKGTLYVDRTAGATDVVDVALQGKFSDCDVWEDIATVTDSSTEAPIHGPSVDFGEPDTHLGKKFDQYRILCTTVGNGNTLTAVAELTA